MSYLTLVPAYGRDYKSKAAVEADFNADKDFIVQDISSPHDGRYVNRRDLVKFHNFSGATVNIRYKKLASVAVIKVKATT